MPHLLGTNFIRTLKNPPKVIFTTAYRKYAVEGFDGCRRLFIETVNFERFLKGVIKFTSKSGVIMMWQLILQIMLSPFAFLYFRANRKMVSAVQ
jgi:hypothetical protein